MTKENLIKQFTTYYDENGWFVRRKNAAKDLTTVAANPGNSIWEIVLIGKVQGGWDASKGVS